MYTIIHILSTMSDENLVFPKQKLFRKCFFLHIFPLTNMSFFYFKKLFWINVLGPRVKCSEHIDESYCFRYMKIEWRGCHQTATICYHKAIFILVVSVFNHTMMRWIWYLLVMSAEEVYAQCASTPREPDRRSPCPPHLRPLPSCLHKITGHHRTQSELYRNMCECSI